MSHWNHPPFETTPYHEAASNYNATPTMSTNIPDISHSNLTATAREFTPSSSATGAVRKKNNNFKGNSGRQFVRTESARERDWYGKNQSNGRGGGGDYRSNRDCQGEEAGEPSRGYNRGNTYKNGYGRYGGGTKNNKTYYARNNNKYKDNRASKSSFEMKDDNWRRPDVKEGEEGGGENKPPRSVSSSEILKKKCKLRHVYMLVATVYGLWLFFVFVFYLQHYLNSFFPIYYCINLRS